MLASALSRYTFGSITDLFTKIRVAMAAHQDDVEALVAEREYKAGFVTDLEADTVAPGLNEDVIRFISKRRMNRNGCWNGG